MGLMQKAMETYDANISRIGVYSENEDPLAPIGHILTSANIEITINFKGEFVAARRVDKTEPKILIPVTEESSGRTSAPAAHPLCEQIKYIATEKEKEHSLYLEGLHRWADSEYSHPFLTAIISYVEKGSVVLDLQRLGIIENAGKSEKEMVCWRVLGIDGEEPACWKNKNLFQKFVDFYLNSISDRKSELCMLEGSVQPVALQHPKGVISINGNAKLISANDTSGFTYRGRFIEENQALTIGYVASQKAHNAIRWLASNQGVREFSGNRIFLCWSPQGKKIPKVIFGLVKDDPEPKRKPSDYRENLKSTLFSFREDNHLKGNEDAVLTAFDAATTGRLAVTYYNEINLEVFLNRMEDWDSHCCWYRGKFGIQAPNLLEIVECAFGVQRGNIIEVDDKIRKQHLQRLLDCKVNGGNFPQDIKEALVQRASMPLAYEERNWRNILFVTCAVIQKFNYDKHKGGNEMEWELDKKDRSFQFGRLLAVMERAEDDYYDLVYKKTGESSKRQTNAIKFLSEYRQRPMYVFERINRQLQPYINRIKYWQAKRYKDTTDEIFNVLSEFPKKDLNKPLDCLYLMGYELQRNAFFTKKEDTDNTNIESTTEEE